MKEKALIGSGIVAAIASSLCCIIPLLALIAGGTGVATSLSWLEPLRPFLIGFTIIVLGYAWYQKLKPQKDCCINQKTNFMETKSFLTIVTIFALSMLSFPSFSGNFYNNTPIEHSAITDSSKVVLNIEGMTCGGFLHQTANNIKYYPNWIDRFNLRGFYRMYDEPYLIKRYFVWYPWALIKYTIDSFRYNKLKRKRK